MNKRDHYTLSLRRPALRFARWSRKGYAMFCSMGRCVTIGVVRIEIADRQQAKGEACSVADSHNPQQQGERVQEAADDWEGDNLLLATLLPTITEIPTCGCSPSAPFTIDFSNNNRYTLTASARGGIPI